MKERDKLDQDLRLRTQASRQGTASSSGHLEIYIYICVAARWVTYKYTTRLLLCLMHGHGMATRSVARPQTATNGHNGRYDESRRHRLVLGSYSCLEVRTFRRPPELRPSSSSPPFRRPALPLCRPEQILHCAGGWLAGLGWAGWGLFGTRPENTSEVQRFLCRQPSYEEGSSLQCMGPPCCSQSRGHFPFLFFSGLSSRGVECVSSYTRR